MLGGGTFKAMNKELPGSYMNFVSAARADMGLSDRGVAAMPLTLDWGPEGEVFSVDSRAFREDSQKIFGYDSMSAEMKGLRDLFKNIRRLYTYRLNSGGVKASNSFCTAKYAGIRGNDLKTVILENEGQGFEVQTLLGSSVVDRQTAAGAGALKDNDWVTFKADAELAATAATPLTGGTNGTAGAGAYSAFFHNIESFSFNVLGIASNDDAVKKEAAGFCRRMRDETGVKFQTVLYGYAADFEGVINVKNAAAGNEPAALVYWVTGIAAGCEVNKTNQNRVYDGEYVIQAGYTQQELVRAMRSGEFVLHRVGQEFRVLDDINSLVTLSAEKGEVFQGNQTIRVIDQIANDIGVLFNTKYFGKVPNDQAGRISLWADIVRHHQNLERIRAIEDFSENDVTVAAGETKKSVVVSDAITVVNTMAQLYMTVTVE